MVANVNKSFLKGFSHSREAVVQANPTSTRSTTAVSITSRHFMLIALSLILLLSSGLTEASLIYFESFTTEGGYYNDPGLNIYANVFGVAGQVHFEFHNESQMTSSIEGIYFEDDVLDGIAGFDCGTGTLYQEWAAAPILPGCQTLNPVFITAYSADSEPSTFHNGIEPGEMLTIILNIDSGATFGNVADRLMNGNLRVGAHVIGFPDDSSISMVTPEPATLLLLGLGTVMLRRKRS